MMNLVDAVFLQEDKDCGEEEEAVADDVDGGDDECPGHEISASFRNVSFRALFQSHRSRGIAGREVAVVVWRGDSWGVFMGGG